VRSCVDNARAKDANLSIALKYGMKRGFNARLPMLGTAAQKPHSMSRLDTFPKAGPR
jgi:hypothetical protein